MQHVLFFGTLAIAAAAFALLEIQIEGDAGWASSLPTWRRESRWTRLLMGGRPLTGYHLWAHVFMLTAAHFPFGLALAPWSWAAEARVLAFLILFWILEDFLWFVFNPAYGLRGFTRRRAGWHAHAWWGFMPREYWIFLPVGVALYALS